jgi:hypothetical protein|tara:strand:+ start:146 stop:346 length:201 start_codon:yes stop_codon:yes gene_type:complete
MTQRQIEALKVLIYSARVAQGRGAYRLEEAEIISRAIQVFSDPQKSSIPDFLETKPDLEDDSIAQE